jgi:hypothetical protein
MNVFFKYVYIYVYYIYIENLLDSDQNDEVQANAAELLANVSRYNGDLTGKLIHVYMYEFIYICIYIFEYVYVGLYMYT